MAEESSAGLSEQLKEMMAQNEKLLKAIQDQIADQLEAQRKAIADLVEAEQKTIAGFPRTAAERQNHRPVGGSAQGVRRSARAAVEHPAESDHGAGGTAVECPKEGYRGRAECNRRDVPT
jgi:hypothetical protein